MPDETVHQIIQEMTITPTISGPLSTCPKAGAGSAVTCFVRVCRQRPGSRCQSALADCSTKFHLASILPKAIRDQLHWGAGTRLTVENTPEGVLLKSAPVFAASSIDSLFGSMRHTGPALSIDEMNAAIAREAQRCVRD